jgi:hypothetical protein
MQMPSDGEVLFNVLSSGFIEELGALELSKETSGKLILPPAYVYYAHHFSSEYCRGTMTPAI